jgi:hypothetical protein
MQNFEEPDHKTTHAKDGDRTEKKGCCTLKKY